MTMPCCSSASALAEHPWIATESHLLLSLLPHFREVALAVVRLPAVYLAIDDSQGGRFGRFPPDERRQ